MAWNIKELLHFPKTLQISFWKLLFAIELKAEIQLGQKNTNDAKSHIQKSRYSIIHLFIFSSQQNKNMKDKNARRQVRDLLTTIAWLTEEK